MVEVNANNIKNLFTFDEALNLHREMWRDMQLELGDCPSGDERKQFKHNWVEKHGRGGEVESDCFLCEYTAQIGRVCDYCPIDWSSNGRPILRCHSFCNLGGNGIGNYYLRANISEILSLQERNKFGVDIEYGARLKEERGRAGCAVE